MPGRRANRHKKTPKSEILKYIINSLHTGQHSHMLYFVNKAEDEFEIKFVNLKSSDWEEKDISLFRALDELYGHFKTEPDYKTRCKVRARGNLSGLCKRGLLEYRGEIHEDKATKIKRYRILKHVEGSINPKTMKNVSSPTTGGFLPLKTVRTVKSSLQQSVGDPCAYIYQAESEMQKSESQSSEIKENHSKGSPQTAWASPNFGNGTLTTLVPDHTGEAPNYTLGSPQTSWAISNFGNDTLTTLVPDHTGEAPNYSLGSPQTAWAISNFGNDTLTTLVPDHTGEAPNYSLSSPQAAWARSSFGNDTLTTLLPDHTGEAPNYSLGSPQTAWARFPFGNETLTTLVPDHTGELLTNSLGCPQTALGSSPSRNEFLQQNSDVEEFLPSPLADRTREAFNISPLPDLENFGELDIPRLLELFE